ncbi:hypothetical protein [Glaciecola sp. 1036]|uniref:hypothetical protein n=1 Tax=Alteromonadaceae TaxID=72275 RepID=UPI003D0395C8
MRKFFANYKGREAEFVIQKILFFTILLIFNTQLAQARLVLVQSDEAFDNATQLQFLPEYGFGAGQSQLQFSVGATTFDFNNTSPIGTLGQNTIVAWNPDPIIVSFSPGVQSVGFIFTSGECSGRARFVGTLGTEDHTLEFGAFN